MTVSDRKYKAVYYHCEIFAEFISCKQSALWACTQHHRELTTRLNMLALLCFSDNDQNVHLGFHTTWRLSVAGGSAFSNKLR